jgi:two-component system KDP operon response regulator KdpE
MSEARPVFVTGSLSVDREHREVRIHDSPVQLTPIEYDLLSLFVEHAGKVLTHHQLVREILGRGAVRRRLAPSAGEHQ